MLRVPIRISESYVSPGDEKHLFPEYENFLTREEVSAVFPSGLANQETFQHLGVLWRMQKRYAGSSGGSPTYIAIFDGGDPSTVAGTSSTTAQSAIHSSSGGGGHQHLGSHSLPDAPSTTASPIAVPCGYTSYNCFADPPAVTTSVTPVDRTCGSYLEMQQAYSTTTSTAASSPSTSIAAPSGHRRNGGSGGQLHQLLPPTSPSRIRNNNHQHHQPQHQQQAISLRSSNPLSQQWAAPPQQPLQPSAYQERNKFIEDLLLASDSPVALDRYKALIRLMSALKRASTSSKCAFTATGGTPVGAKLDAWDGGSLSCELEEQLRQIIMVGECLARFGTADFALGSNSSRALTALDYAKLLMQFLEQCGAVFLTEFIDRIPQVLQDEVLTVRSLLQTRCEANKLIFDQLIRAVGMENHTSAVVFNTTTANANPINHASSNPQHVITTQAGAAADANAAAAVIAPAPKRRSLGEIAAAAGLLLVGGLFLKHRLMSGRRRRGGDGGRYDDEGGRYNSQQYFGHGNDGPGGGRRGGAPLPSTSAERLAVRYLAACSDELRKAQRNAELLRHDWRLGTLRLAVDGSMPPGYEAPDATYCSLHNYLDGLEGRGGGELPNTTA